VPSPPDEIAKLTERNPGIDLVRGIAIIFVVIHHMSLRIPLAKTSLSAVLPHQLLQGLSWDGYEAVFVFFVVSGFLITRNLLTRWTALCRLNPRIFYARRAARIMPCLLVLVAALSALDLLHAPNYVILKPGQSLPGAIFAALALHLNWYEGRTGYLPGGWDVLWSLSIEEVFYLGFPLVCLTIGRYRNYLIILLAVLAVSLPFELNALSNASETWREKAYLPGMSAIAMGVCAALAVPQEPRRFLASGAGWLGTSLIAAIFWWENRIYSLVGNATMLLLTSSAALLMVAFHFGWANQWTAKRASWLRSFGIMSYEIYLTHMFVVFTIAGIFRISRSNLYFGWLWFPPALAFSWGLGRLVERFLSSPADKWLRDKFAVATTDQL